MRRLISGGLVLASVLVGGCDEAPNTDPATTPATQENSESVPPPLAPQVGLVPGMQAALVRGISPPTFDDGTYRVDPFVAVVLYEQVRAENPLSFVQAQGSAPTGYRVPEVEADGVLERLGLRSGDIIEKLNGRGLSGPDAAALALEAAEHRVTVTIFRDGLSFTNSYRFDGGLAWRDVLATPEPDTEPPAPVEEPPPLAEPATEAEPSARRPTTKTTRPKPRPSPSPRSKSGQGAPRSTDIRCSGADACSITQQRFDALRASPSKLQSGVELVPAIRNDVFSGYKLKRVSGNSVAHKLGFRSGDKVTHVNGRDLTDDAQAMALYWSLGGTKVFKVRYQRGGRNRTKTIRVV